MSKAAADNLTTEQALLILNGHSALGPVSRRRLLEAFDNNPLRVLGASHRELTSVQGIGAKAAQTVTEWATRFDLAREERRLAEHNTAFLGVENPGYPPLLREIYDPPIGLYVKGPVRPKLKTVAIVGTRHASLYGQGVARRLGADLAKLGFCVVSGLARGVDTAAHQGALDVDGETVAVLGCGLDIVYPPDNLELYRAIAERGALIAELPFGTPPTRNTFPMRNRLISGISQAIVVVESAESGGSMITARFAGEHGRHLLAVPGRIDQETARGCHQLIRDGATLLTGVDDLLQELAYGGKQAELDLGGEPKPAAPPKDWDAGLSAEERAVLATLIEGDKRMPDTIAATSGLPVSAVAATLLMLELKKRVVKYADGRFEARF